MKNKSIIYIIVNVICILAMFFIAGTEEVGVIGRIGMVFVLFMANLFTTLIISEYS